MYNHNYKSPVNRRNGKCESLARIRSDKRKKKNKIVEASKIINKSRQKKMDICTKSRPID